MVETEIGDTHTTFADWDIFGRPWTSNFLSRTNKLYNDAVASASREPTCQLQGEYLISAQDYIVAVFSTLLMSSKPE